MSRDRGRRPAGGTAGVPDVPRATAPDHSSGHPKFCFRFLQTGFDVGALAREQRADLALTLQQRASQTWRQLHQAGRHTQGYELLPRSMFRPAVPAVFEDQPRFTAFRYSGRLPMVGVRAGDVFHVVWIEARFGDLYSHG